MANELTRRLVDAADERFGIDRTSMSYTDWVCQNTTIAGRQFSVKGYPFQRAILDDMHQNMDVVKCSQIGLTEIQIRKGLAFLYRNRATSAIFTFPDEKTFKKNSMTRIAPIVEQEKIFNTARDKRAIRNTSLYQIGKSFMHVVMCQETDATSTPADMVISDEVDLSDQKWLSLFSSRVQNSEHMIRQRFSTPTFPSFGVDLGYQASDQMKYLVRCHKCNHWNDPEFDERFVCVPGMPDGHKLTEIDHTYVDMIRLDESFVHCEKCRAPLDLGNPSLREWVAAYPNRKHHRGRAVSPFATQRLGPAYIITQLLEYKQNQFVRGFHNTVLGKPYADGNIRLDDADINACFTNNSAVPTDNRSANTWVGIDVGQTCHLTIGQGSKPENMHIVSFEAIPVDKLAERVKDIMATYNLVGGCIDRMPYTPTADMIMQISGGKIVPAHYVPTTDLRLVNDAFGTLNHVAVNRTANLDTVHRVVRNRYLRMSGYGYSKSVVTEHLKQLVRDETPEKPAVWVKLSQNDHFFHSIGYCLLAPKVKELIRVSNQDEVRTQVQFVTPKLVADNGNMLDRSPRKAYNNPLLKNPG